MVLLPGNHDIRWGDKNEKGDFVLLALNSTRIEASDYAGIGYVGLDQIYSLLQQLDYGMRSRPCRLIAALHHHLLPIEAVRLPQMARPAAERKLSFVTDGSDVLRALLEVQADAVLHGHMHLPHHCFHGFVPLDGGRQALAAISAAAGSIGLGKASRNISGPHRDF